MNSVGIDVSKGKSMIAVMRPFGEVVCSPFVVSHSPSELSNLAKMLKSLDGETRVVMEATGNYHLPIAIALHEAGSHPGKPAYQQLVSQRHQKKHKNHHHRPSSFFTQQQNNDAEEQKDNIFFGLAASNR